MNRKMRRQANRAERKRWRPALELAVEQAKRATDMRHEALREISIAELIRHGLISSTEPKGPAVDRMDPTFGYVKGNVRLVTNQARIATSDMLTVGQKIQALRLMGLGSEDIIELCDSLTRHKYNSPEIKEAARELSDAVLLPLT